MLVASSMRYARSLRYVDNYVMLARVIRLEADVKHSRAKPKTVDEALAELESAAKSRRQIHHQVFPAAEGRSHSAMASVVTGYRTRPRVI